MSGDWRICIDFGTALSKAAVAPVASAADASFDDVARRTRPLAIGQAAGETAPFFARCALFLTQGRIHFGQRALARAEAESDSGREALLSFKTILAAPDLEAALAARAPRAVDPHGLFSRRDLVVLYLAWLLTLVDAAASAGGVLTPGHARLRYTRPGWRPEAVDASHHVVARLIDEADMAAAICGARLRDEGGLDLEEARRALERAAASHAPSRVDECVFEAVAAAACRLEGAGARAGWLVFDMGAGTTDLAAVFYDEGRAREIAKARMTLSAAGDHLDRILLNRFLARARKAKSVEAQSALWRALLLSVRERKEGLFLDGKAVVRFAGQALTVRRAEVEGDEDFKGFRDALRAAYAQSLETSARAASEAGLRELDIVLAGGGAHLPFVRDMALKTKAKSRVTLRVADAMPPWARAEALAGQLAPLYPQLSIAMGGAMAPPALAAT